MKKEDKQAESEAQPADFESALGELEEIVESLESGELSLADSLERFKRGVTLSKQCHRLIDDARQSVETLSDPDREDSATAQDA
ncbi:exodeoxyribonuclease VII small subunit [Wenzhouxiangella sp. AB-CW3]|uniref:exodeoxyribonuclease VII small subunit n=1 Tax=Wenzhouxiangella sp. AB-CW3 TaxID=2771012 RepID=UPI00168AD7DD|nr:exodeoxyribonuclease VII small subunit [Wenzhouxiangella sp. AB-CW3]QOC21137.1 exodeoxyribonuclease VII small subunit [Wenzhouxiangella sp. AB-CW3]